MPQCRRFTSSERKASKAALGRTGPESIRNQTMFVLGCCTGFRISELLSLRLRDVLDQSGKITQAITITGSKVKRGKTRTVDLGREAREALSRYVKYMKAQGWLHRDTPIFHKAGKAISRFSAGRILRRASDRAGIGADRDGIIGTHSMRKTFGHEVHAYLMALAAKGEAVDVLLETAAALGHGDPKSTTIYLQLNKKNVRRAILSVGNRRF